MIRVIYVGHDGSRREVEAVEGVSVMQAAVQNGVGGIEGDCGGACACATCHVHVESAWTALTGEASPEEAEMLEFANGVDARSRLSCQIRLSAALDGLTVQTPASQR